MGKPMVGKKRVTLHLDSDVAVLLDAVGTKRKGQYISQLVRNFSQQNELLHRVKDMLDTLEKGQTP